MRTRAASVPGTHATLCLLSGSGLYGQLALILSALALALSAGAGSGARLRRSPPRSSDYLALAQTGVARAERRWSDPRRGWYDARLGDRERYPLATIWDIVPLFESIDAIAIAEPTPAKQAGRRALRRGRRALPEPRPAPGARLLALPRRPRRRHRDVVRRQRLVGSRVPERLPRDRHAALAERRRARARLHRRGRLGPRDGRHLVEHRATPTRPARRSPRARCWPRCSTSRRTRVRYLEHGAHVPRLGQHHRLQRVQRPVRRQQPEPDADRLHRGAADLRAGGAVPADRRTRRTANAPSELTATALDRFGYLLDFSPQYDAIYLQWMLALYSLDRRPDPVLRSPPTTRATPRRARSTAKACTCSPGTAKRCPRRTRCRGCCRRRRPPRACSPGWRCTRRRPEGAHTPSTRRATRSNTRSGSSRLASSIALASRPTR